MNEIKEKERIERYLKESEEKYKIIAENTVECIWILDVMNKKFKYVSPSIFSLRGLTVEEAMEENFQDSLTPESLERVNNSVKERLPKFLNNESQDGYFDEVRQYCKDGSIKDIEISTKFMYDEKNGLPIVLGVSRDITERKIIIAKNAYHRNLLESSLDPLVTVDLNGKITDLNIATIKATGYTKEELVGTDFSEYFTEPKKAREGYKKAFDLGEVRDYLLELKNKDGSIMTVAYNASVYRDENENVVGVFAAARDITEKKKMEDELG
nr:PAS domain S-box protein [Spirochaetota bacterium]